MMKKTMLLLSTLLLLGSAAQLRPCDVTAETQPAKEKGRIQVKLCVDRFHRSCPLDIGKTDLKAEGLVIEKKGEWRNVKGSLYEIDLVVRLIGKKPGTITVLRCCPKRGPQEEIVAIEPL
jgi:hypothetical protein